MSMVQAGVVLPGERALRRCVLGVCVCVCMGREIKRARRADRKWSLATHNWQRAVITTFIAAVGVVVPATPANWLAGSDVLLPSV